ncbi:MAG TPA: histidine kinase [Gaiellaceae bacterium]|nr:histidine kinase [Gaiellaceae bacterium]
MPRTAVALAISALGIAAGSFTLDVAREDPGYWFAGDSALGAAALLGAGWTLIGCGLAAWARRPESRFGPLLVAAGFAWFLLEWNNPGIGSPLAFTAGLCLYASCPPLVAHALLASAPGRAASRLVAAALAAAYCGFVLLLGVLPALFFDPVAQGCSQCPRNLLLVDDRPELSAELIRAGVYAGLVCALALVALVSHRLLQTGAATRRAILAAGAGYLLLVAGLLASSLDRGGLVNGAPERRLWLGQAAALVGLGVATVWAWMRQRRARSQVARLVVDLAESPPPGGLRDILAGIVGDPELVLAYPLDGAHRLVDAQGRAVALPDRAARTTLLSGDRPVAVLGHAPGLLGDEQLVDEVASAARLALENERLQAEVRARLEELRHSRARIVAAGDAERRRLERDLHDGAQQRLVGLSLSLRLLRTRAGTPAPQLARAQEELRLAVAELRDLAHGIFPAVLADEGLAAAVEALAEEAGVPLRIASLPEGRLAPPVETAAYTVVAEAARAARAPLDVRASRTEDVLAVDVATRAADGIDLLGLHDRVGALDGRISAARAANGGVTIHAELPCAS